MGIWTTPKEIEWHAKTGDDQPEIIVSLQCLDQASLSLRLLLLTIQLSLVKLDKKLRLDNCRLAQQRMPGQHQPYHNLLQQSQHK